MRKRTIKDKCIKRGLAALLTVSLLSGEPLPVLAEGGEPEETELCADDAAEESAAGEEITGEGTEPYWEPDEQEEYILTPDCPDSPTELNPSVIDTPYDYYEMRAQLEEGEYEQYRTEQESRGLAAKAAAPAFPCSYEEDWLSYLTDNYPDNRNQNPFGTCWAHSSMGLLEFYLINQGLADRSIDLSEAHLIYWNYVNGTPSVAGDTGDRVTLVSSGLSNALWDGGNVEHAVNTLMRQRGAAAESTAPYAQIQAVGNAWTGPAADTERQDVTWLKNGYFIGIKENPEQVKAAIVKNGAVGISYYDRAKNYNGTYNSYYNDTDTKTNHAVMVVGWDDSFPAGCFEKDPGTDGAWLIRNSWSTESRAARNSYFWLSYADTSIKGAWILEAATDFPYDNHYYYDSQIHWSGSRSYTDTTQPGYSANVYTVCGSGGASREKLEAVTFQAPQKWEGGTDYSILVYRNLTDPENPASGHLEVESVTKGTVYYSGEYTVRLKRPVILDKGERFSIVVRTENGRSLSYEVPVYNWNFVSSEVNAEPGQSFWSNNTENWRDLTECGCSYTYMDEPHQITPNFVLSALTTDVPEPEGVYHSVRFEWREGSSEKQIRHGTAPDPMRVPMPVSGDFVCWTDKESGEVWDPTAPVTGDLTLTACYEKDLSGTGSPADPVPELKEDGLYLISGQSFYPDPAVKWQLADSDAVKADKDHRLLKAVKEGSAVLDYEADGEKKRITVYVVEPETAKKSLTLIRGQEEKLVLKLSCLGKDLTEYYPVLWESSDPSVATVQNGTVIAGTKGNCEISAIVGGKRFRCKLKVKDTETPVLTGTEDEITLIPLQSVSLKRKGFSYKNMSWESEAGMKRTGSEKKAYYEDAVIRIGTDGKVTAVGVGSTVLTGTRTEKDGTLTKTQLTVRVEEMPEQRIYLNVGSQKPLRFYGVKNKDATGWISDSPSVVSVDAKGRVYGISAGSAVVSCTYKGFVYRARIFSENYALKESKELSRKKPSDPFNYTAELVCGKSLRLTQLKGEGYESWQPAHYSSSKPEVAYVDQYGVLHALSTGSVTLSCRRNGKNLKILLKVV